MLTKEIEKLLNFAHKEAVSRHHRIMVVEHLLYAICASEVGSDFLRGCDVDVERLSLELEFFFKNQKPGKSQTQPITSVVVERVIKRAVEHSLRSEQDSCTVMDVLAAMMKEEESYGVGLLKKQNLTLLQVLKQIQVYENIKEVGLEGKTGSSQEREVNISEVRKGKSPSLTDEKILRDFLIDLNMKAKKGEIDPLIGREEEMQRLLLILGRRKKNNPILVGDPGVGKTAMAEGLAKGIEEKIIHQRFHSHQVYSLELGSLLAGTKFRGDFEERITRIFAILKKKKNCIVFIDEIHTLVGAGSTSGSGVDASNLLKPLLTSGDVQVIGATTFEEYRNYFQKDAALNRRFEKVEIPESSIAETIEILKSLSGYYSDYHKVTYPEEVIIRLPNLCQNYFLEKHLPDGAIDIMDLAGSLTKMKHPQPKVRPTVSLKEVEKLISQISGIPLREIENKKHFSYLKIVKDIRKQVFGQDHVIERVLKTVKLSKLGLRDGGRPIGSFLFTGPTGVGKTELCRVLGRVLGMRLIRLDMSEYMESHSVSKLIGSPPGYVGFNDRKGELTEQVKKHPHCLILLDEIEKAHPDVVNIFLQVMDYGRLTDSTGEQVNFENTLIILTSNLGATEMSSQSVGFGEKDGKLRLGEDAIKEFFRPEFRNRLTATLRFNFLPETVIRSIIAKLLEEMNTALSVKNIVVVMEREAVNYLLSHGYDPKMGGRSIKRVFEGEVKEKVADFLFAKGKVFFNKINSSLPQQNQEKIKLFFYHDTSANCLKIKDHLYKP